MNHQTRSLSGGELKRLTIALELIDDPTILFLDEPTTGLDSSSSTQCIQLLKKLAKEGKTIVCTIHSPSAILFEMVDLLYALADGRCIYQGSSSNLVPFLSELELICPEIYSPPDFLLEIATNDYGPQNDRLCDKIANGSNCRYRKSPVLSFEEDLNLQLPSDFKSLEYSTSFYQQFKHLLIRNFLTSYRDKTLSLMRLLINIGVGLGFGTIYFGIGNDASFIFDIQKFIVYSVYHSMFFGFNSQLTACEYKQILKVMLMKICSTFSSTGISDAQARTFQQMVFSWCILPGSQHDRHTNDDRQQRCVCIHNIFYDESTP